MNTVDMEDGFIAPVEFEQLMLLDQWTPDGRRIESSGFGTRNMPRPIYLHYRQSEGGHLGAEIAGRLDEITIAADGVVSGRGWLLDDAMGRKAALYLKTKAITGNSVDLADVRGEIVEYTPTGAAEPRFGVSFTQANIGATTLVGIPAFPDATAGTFSDSDLQIIEDIERGETLHATSFHDASRLRVVTGFAPAITSTDAPMDWFVGSEGRRAYPLTVEANGRVHGYLSDWQTRHLTNAGRMTAPKGRGYRYFNASAVLTKRGTAYTGPLVIGGDHASGGKNWTQAKDYYASTSYAWADVHATDDRHGIRLNGMVRPGAAPEAVHAGRASRLSGDWRRVEGHMELIAALSVNSPAFPVARTFSSEVDASLILFAPVSFAAEEGQGLSARDRMTLVRARLLTSQECES